MLQSSCSLYISAFKIIKQIHYNFLALQRLCFTYVFGIDLLSDLAVSGWRDAIFVKVTVVTSQPGMVQTFMNSQTTPRRSKRRSHVNTASHKLKLYFFIAALIAQAAQPIHNDIG